jgi:hypothetical protein
LRLKLVPFPLTSCPSSWGRSGGRLLLIETSALPAFDSVRRFYAKRGYAEGGCIPDYYADGDGKVSYYKRTATDDETGR